MNNRGNRGDRRRGEHSRHAQSQAKIHAAKTEAATARVGDIQGEVDLTLRSASDSVLKAMGEFKEKPELNRDNTVLLIARGNARMAEMYLPEEVTSQGARGVFTQLCDRAKLIECFNNIDVNVVNVLSNPWECGKDKTEEIHLQTFVATSSGGAIQCTHCDLGVRQRPPAKA